MGSSHGDFHKYPRTPHLFGSTGTDDDKHLSERESLEFINDDSLIVEEKQDGANVGISYASNNKMILQCRGHEITSGMHPQFDLFKQWATCFQDTFEAILEDRYVMYGEWMYAKHSIHYRALSHYFYEFDIFDKQTMQFLSLESRSNMLSLADGMIKTVPVIGRGKQTEGSLRKLIGVSAFDSEFENPTTCDIDKSNIDNLMEGLYLRTEKDGFVSGRAKFVRPEFTEKVKQSDHWKNKPMIINKLASNANIWS